MPHTPTPCALLLGTPDHAATLSALATLLQRQGWQVHRHTLPTPGTPSGATGPADVAQVFDPLAAQGQHPSLVVFGAGHWAPASALDTSAADWAQAWHSQCEQGLRVAQAAVRSMRASGHARHPAPRGTLVFLGHADGVTDGQPARQRAPGAFGAFSAPHAASSAGLRALAQAFARACGPQGIHVAHLALSRTAPGAPDTSAEAIAQACWMLHQQGRSAWTHELDLRA